jgi:hypothetical protein
MNSSPTTRTAALFAAVIVTFTGVKLMADYARPANEPTALAQAEAGSSAARGTLQRVQAGPRDLAARGAAFPADRAARLAETARLR